jgi:hypothetical protein
MVMEPINIFYSSPSQERKPQDELDKHLMEGAL